MARELPYEATVASTFSALLGYRSGRRAGSSLGRFQERLGTPGPVIGIQLLDRTVKDKAWADAVAHTDGRAALIEFKRDGSRSAAREEVDKGKHGVVQRLSEAGYGDVVGGGHWYVYGGEAGPAACLYTELDKIVSGEPPESLPSSCSADALAESLLSLDGGVPLERLHKYMNALNSTGEKYTLIGYFLAVGRDGRLMATMFENLSAMLLPIEQVLAATQETAPPDPDDSVTVREKRSQESIDQGRPPETPEGDSPRRVPPQI